MERIGGAWGKQLRDPSDFRVGRRGDHILTPFECDLCVFRKLRKTDPEKRNPQDKLLLGVIRRMNLDAFWSRASGTVLQNADRAKMGIELSSMLGLQGPYEDTGNYPPHDHCGYEIAAVILMHSRRPGKYSSGYTQYQTIRKHRSTFGNQVRAATQSNTHPLVTVDDKGIYRRIVNDKTGSLWFNRFMIGLHNRMGEISKQNKALSLTLMLRLVSLAEGRYTLAEEDEERNRWSCFLVYSVISYVLSLRGSEGFMIDVESTYRLKDRNDGTYQTIGLMGRVKGEVHDRCHLVPCVWATGSGIRVRDILSRHMKLKQQQDIVKGPAVSDLKGNVLKSTEIDDMLLEIIEEMYDESPDSFPAEIDSKEKLRDGYHCFRTFRRTSDTQALNAGVDGEDIDIVNRWAKKEKAGSRTMSQPMKQHYADFELLIEPFKRYGAKL